MERLRILTENIARTGSSNSAISVVMLVAVFVLLFFGMYFTYQYLIDGKMIKRQLDKVYRRMDANEKLRIATEKRNKELYGKVDKISFQTKVDLKLKHSGVRDKFPWCSTEVFFGLVGIFGGILFLMIRIVTGKTFYSFLGFIAAPIITYAILEVMSVKRYNDTEESVIGFANIIENFASGTSDLITIFEKSAVYIDEPLRTALNRCVATARTTGDIGLAIDELQENIEYEQFQMLVRNLEISSRYEANYIEIIHENREMLQTHLRDQRERKAIYREGRIQILTLLGLGGWCCSMLGGINGTSESIIDFLLSSFSGTLVLVLLVVIILICLFLAFVKGNK